MKGDITMTTNNDAMSMEQLRAAVSVMDNHEDFKKAAKLIGYHRGMGYITKEQEQELTALLAARYDEVFPRAPKINWGALVAMAVTAVKFITRDELKEDFACVARWGRRIGMIPTAGIVGVIDGGVGGVAIVAEAVANTVRRWFGK